MATAGSLGFWPLLPHGVVAIGTKEQFNTTILCITTLQKATKRFGRFGKSVTKAKAHRPFSGALNAIT